MIITPNLFAKIQEIGEKYCTMPNTLSEIAKKNNALPTEIQYMQKFYAQQKYEVEKLKIEMDELYGKKFKYYRIEDNVQWNTTKEIESQIFADKDYAAKNRQLAEQKYYLNYIEETLSNLKDLHYTIKNYLDYKKITTTNM